jgi:acyl-CoA thioesterase-1
MRLASFFGLPLLCFLVVGCLPEQCARRGVAQSVTEVSSGTPPDTIPDATPDARRVLVFLGDSLTAGYGLASREAFPARVEELMAREGLGATWRVVNAGVSGDTSRGGLERLDWVFRSKPDVVFLCLGANDGLRGIDVAETEKNLRALVEGIRQRGARVVLAGMRLPSNYGPEYRESFAALYPRLAKEYSVPLLPFLIDKIALDSRFTLPDGIHPNAEGANRIASEVWTFLAPTLNK